MPAPKIVLVSTNAGQDMGGEAIKAHQFFKHLIETGRDATLIVHARCRSRLEEFSGRIVWVEDDAAQKFLWKATRFEPLLDLYFHLKVRRAVRDILRAHPNAVVHYICPVSPVWPRFPPSEAHCVLGPVTGNIGYPPALRKREGLFSALRKRLQIPIQSLLRVAFADKRRFRTVLVSGYERTRASLRAAGRRDRDMIDVVDSGISEAILATPRIAHRGANRRFVAVGRFVDYKAFDLAIRAVAHAGTVSLDIFGDGPKGPAWRALSEELGVSDRVRFAGWRAHADLLERMREYRGFVFPSLAEANGIAMQEAMAIGLPAVALRWGGPSGLADDESACWVEPRSEGHIVRDIARHMIRLAEDPEFADALSKAARRIAQTRFGWNEAAASWTAAYDAPETRSGR